MIDGEIVRKRTQLVWAIASLCILLASALVVGLSTVITLNSKTVSIQFDSATGVAVGQDVRLGGIPVGKVRRLDVENSFAVVEATVKLPRGVNPGSETGASIRMLSPVGGYYIKLLPSGKGPLPDTIAPSRTSSPYQVSKMLDKLGSKSDEVDGDALGKALQSVRGVLTGSPGALRTTVDSVGSVVEVLQKQKDDVRESLSILSEYAKAANMNKAITTQLLIAGAYIAPKLAATKALTKSFLDSLSYILTTVFDVIGGIWRVRLEPYVLTLEKSAETLQKFLKDLTSGWDQVEPAIRKAAGGFGAGGDPLDLSSKICIPSSGSEC